MTTPTKPKLDFLSGLDAPQFYDFNQTPNKDDGADKWFDEVHYDICAPGIPRTPRIPIKSAPVIPQTPTIPIKRDLSKELAITTPKEKNVSKSNVVQSDKENSSSEINKLSEEYASKIHIEAPKSKPKRTAPIAGALKTSSKAPLPKNVSQKSSAPRPVPKRSSAPKDGPQKSSDIAKRVVQRRSAARNGSQKSSVAAKGGQKKRSAPKRPVRSSSVVGKVSSQKSTKQTPKHLVAKRAPHKAKTRLNTAKPMWGRATTRRLPQRTVSKPETRSRSLRKSLVPSSRKPAKRVPKRSKSAGFNLTEPVGPNLSKGKPAKRIPKRSKSAGANLTEPVGPNLSKGRLIPRVVMSTEERQLREIQQARLERVRKRKLNAAFYSKTYKSQQPTSSKTKGSSKTTPAPSHETQSSRKKLKIAPLTAQRVRVSKEADTALFERTRSRPARKPMKLSAGITTPQAPTFKTDDRRREVTTMSFEEKEAREVANRTYFKARPLNRKVLTSDGNVGVPKVPKKPVTTFDEFNLSQRSKRELNGHKEISSKPPKAQKTSARAHQQPQDAEASVGIEGKSSDSEVMEVSQPQSQDNVQSDPADQQKSSPETAPSQKPVQPVQKKEAPTDDKPVSQRPKRERSRSQSASRVPTRSKSVGHTSHKVTKHKKNVEPKSNKFKARPAPKVAPFVPAPSGKTPTRFEPFGLNTNKRVQPRVVKKKEQMEKDNQGRVFKAREFKNPKPMPAQKTQPFLP